MLHHEREAVGGRIAVEVGRTMNAGHIPGRHEFASRLRVPAHLVTG